MIGNLKPYPVMKDSGVPWLESVPTHWEVAPLKRFVLNDPGAIRAGPFGSQLTSAEMTGVDYKVYTQRNVIDRDLDGGRKYVSQEKFNTLRAFEVVPGDVLVTSRGTIGRTVIVKEGSKPGVLHPCLLRVRPDCTILAPIFLLTLIQDSQLLPLQLQFLSNATTIDVIYSDTLANVVLPVPPLAEQTAIVRFLDYVDRRVRRYVRAKQKLIKLLEEHKQAIIHQAVTRGLDPAVPLKDSGVDWLGKVPENWEVVRFKYRVGFQEGPGIMASDFRETGVPLLRISCLQGSVATLDGCNYLDPHAVQRRWKHFRVRVGDYLLSASASTGATVLATKAVEGAIPYTGIIRLWPLSMKTHMPFLKLYLGCQPFQAQIESAKSGVAISHFGPTHLNRMVICLPSIEEQTRIVEFVNEFITPTAAVIEQSKREIELLREYRTRLIADVVTGKVDVREAAANLPDDHEDDESADEGTDLIDGDDELADDLEAVIEEAEA